MNQKVAELQRMLQDKQQENITINEARNVALQQIATLKKHASQLQNFKKNISTMLQVLHTLSSTAIRPGSGDNFFFADGQRPGEYRWPQHSGDAGQLAGTFTIFFLLCALSWRQGILFLAFLFKHVLRDAASEP